MRTTFTSENEGIKEICTEFAQNHARPADKRVEFPVTIRHRSSTAKIYRPAGNFNYYRVAYTVAGKRRMQTFADYSSAKEAAERVVRDAANGYRVQNVRCPRRNGLFKGGVGVQTGQGRVSG